MEYFRVINEDDLHDVALLFMCQFNFPILGLDEWYEENRENITDDERNLCVKILSLFNSEDFNVI